MMGNMIAPANKRRLSAGDAPDEYGGGINQRYGKCDERDKALPELKGRATRIMIGPQQLDGNGRDKCTEELAAGIAHIDAGRMPVKYQEAHQCPGDTEQEDRIERV